MVKPLSKRREKAIKLLGLLSLVRWYSVLLVAVAQYLASFFVFNPNEPSWLLVFDLKLHGIVLATAILIAAGYIINAYYDFEKDLINKSKDHMVLNFVISSKAALSLYIFLNFLGLFVAFLASTKIFLFFFMLSFALWFYSHKLQKIAFIREVSASLLTVSSFFSVILHFNKLEPNILLYGFLLYLIALMREFIKEIINARGDVLYGYNTFYVKYGEKKTLLVLHICSIFFVCNTIIFFFSFPDYAKYILLIQAIIILASTTLFIQKRKLKELNTLYKLLLILGVLGIPLVV